MDGGSDLGYTTEWVALSQSHDLSAPQFTQLETGEIIRPSQSVMRIK